MTLESIPDYSGFPGGSTGPIYNEAAFKYFLDVDRARLRRSQRSIVLVLASIRRQAGRAVHLTDASAVPLLEGLTGSVREVDFVGWYRQNSVAGAVLPQAGVAADHERRLISSRITASLQKSLPRDVAAHLHLRVVCLGGKAPR